MENNISKTSHYYNINKYSGHVHKHHFKATDYVKHHKRYFKLNYNQLQILDSLMESGGQIKRYMDKSQNLRYSEHFGLLDFNKTNLEKIIVSGKTTREDNNDLEILLPMDMPDIKDYEYMFHTHPPTPFPGSRISDGILYEFPSISDIYHFADHFNSGETQGSLVITPEGIYIIRAIEGIKKINYPNNNKIFNDLMYGVLKIQKLAIEKYNLKKSDSKQLDLKLFYEDIAQNNEFLKMFNNLITDKWGLQIKIYLKPRKYNEKLKKWVINSLLLPVSAYELK